MVSAARMHDFNLKKVHSSFRSQHREYLFPLFSRVVSTRNKNSRAVRIKGLFFFIAARMHQLRIGAFASKISFATGVDGAFSWHHSS